MDLMMGMVHLDLLRYDENILSSNYDKIKYKFVANYATELYASKSRAAEVLQVSYKTPLTKIKDYQLEEKGGE